MFARMICASRSSVLLQRVLDRERLSIRNERRIEVVRMHVRDSQRVVERRRLRMVQPRQRNALLERRAVRRDGAIEIPLRRWSRPLMTSPSSR